MSNVPDALVEKVAHALHDTMCCDGEYPCKEPVEQPYTTLARAALAAVTTDYVLVANEVWDNMSARPVDRDALIEALLTETLCSRRNTAELVADGLLRSGVVQDAADVRRAVLNEVERKLLAQMKAKQWDAEWAGLSEALGILRKAGERDG